MHEDPIFWVCVLKWLCKTMFFRNFYPLDSLNLSLLAIWSSSPSYFPLILSQYLASSSHGISKRRTQMVLGQFHWLCKYWHIIEQRTDYSSYFCLSNVLETRTSFPVCMHCICGNCFVLLKKENCTPEFRFWWSEFLFLKVFWWLSSCDQTGKCPSKKEMARLVSLESCS